MAYQNWMGFEGCSMRAVRYRQLTPAEHDAVAVDVATEGGAGMTAIGYQLAVNSLGTRRMLTHYTEPLEAKVKVTKVEGKPDVEEMVEPDLDDPKLAWIKIDDTAIELGYAPLFNTKDVAFLEIEYKALHDANPREVAVFMGKRKTVRST